MMQSLGMDFPDQMNSINEVQRLIGLSLSKIQIGRSQRGGLPLHRNLLVATVLSKARDLYMQETMYMNYKIMSAQQRLGNNGEHHHHHHFGVKSRFPDGNDIDQMENDDAIDNACDADEESDSDVDDDDDDDEMINDSEASTSQIPYRVSTIAAMMMQAAVAAASNTSTMNQAAVAAAAVAAASNTGNYASQSKVEDSPDEMAASHQYNYNSSQPAFMPSAKRYLPDNHLLSHQSYLLEDRFPSSTQQQYHNHLQSGATPPSPTRPVSPLLQHGDVRRLDDPMPPQRLSSRDEGFIDDHDCDCEARNFSTLETHMPFQYCYNCAHFQSANGRGPTLVPSPPASCPSSLPTGHHQVQSILNVSNRPSQPTSVAHSPPEGDFTIYDMDSKSTEFKKPMSSVPVRQGTKRPRVLENDQDHSKKACIRSKQDPEPTAVKIDNSETHSNEPCHPAYRYDGVSTTGSPQAMEIDQITSLVSIFSFGQHIVPPNEGSPNTILSSESPAPIASSFSPEDTTSKSQGDNSDSESDTSSDSGHFGEELDTSCGKSQPQDQEPETGPLVAIGSKSTEQELNKIKLASDQTPDAFDCTQAILSSKDSFDPEDENPDDDSDNKSDKSSDSGHSSDDFDNTLDLSITTDNLVQTIIKGSKVLTPTTECVCSTKSC